MTKKTMDTEHNRRWLENNIVYRRILTRIRDRQHLSWIIGVTLHHEWIINSTDYLYVTVTEKLIHDGLIYAVTGNSLSTRTLLSDMFGLYPIWNVI